MLDSTTGIAPSTREAVIKVAYRLLHHVQSAMLTYEMTNSMHHRKSLSSTHYIGDMNQIEGHESSQNLLQSDMFFEFI